jgi:cytochrome bd-type quinol oxidase subunit 1
VALLVVRVEVIVIAILALIFTVQHLQTRWWRTAGGRQITLVAVVAIIEHVMIALVVTRIRISLWFFVVLFAVSAGAWAGWVILQWQVRHAKEINSDELSRT